MNDESTLRSGLAVEQVVKPLVSRKMDEESVSQVRVITARNLANGAIDPWLEAERGFVPLRVDDRLEEAARRLAAAQPGLLLDIIAEAKDPLAIMHLLPRQFCSDKAMAEILAKPRGWAMDSLVLRTRFEEHDSRIKRDLYGPEGPIPPDQAQLLEIAAALLREVSTGRSAEAVVRVLWECVALAVQAARWRAAPAWTSAIFDAAAFLLSQQVSAGCEALSAKLMSDLDVRHRIEATCLLAYTGERIADDKLRAKLYDQFQAIVEARTAHEVNLLAIGNFDSHLFADATARMLASDQGGEARWKWWENLLVANLVPFEGWAYQHREALRRVERVSWLMLVAAIAVRIMIAGQVNGWEDVAGKLQALVCSQLAEWEWRPMVISDAAKVLPSVLAKAFAELPSEAANAAVLQLVESVSRADAIEAILAVNELPLTADELRDARARHARLDWFEKELRGTPV